MKYLQGFKIVLLIVFFSVLNVTGKAQSNKDLYRADQYFSINNYTEATKFYEVASKSSTLDEVSSYRLGVCYISSALLEENKKAEKYLEKAKGFESRDIPNTIYFHLGKAYHINNKYDEAVESFTEFLNTEKKDKDMLKLAELYRSYSSNAKFYTRSPVKADIQTISNSINSELTEYNPVVSADESILAYTAVVKNARTGALEEKVMISTNESGSWSAPIEADIKAKGNIGTAGLSPDGQEMLIYVGSSALAGNLYTVQSDENGWSNPVVLSQNINSKYIESTASLTPDGKKIYFASNRVGGYGGFDIYVSEKDSKGNWSKPKNLGPTVNSKYDEDAPFIHPDQKNLFFTSNSKNSMGGRDIFRTSLTNGDWSKPYNMGYPINTVADDNYFNLTADGKKAYFSSNREGGKGSQDIYMVDMSNIESGIPLTMLKGRILNGETMKPMPTKIYLIDNETNQKLDFVYDPNPKTGDYLIILPPAKNYDMIIECEGFLPYTLNINIPNQTYFYELYQMIYLKTIKQFDEPVGQEVVVKNAFYDTHQDAVADMRKAHEAQLLQSDSIDVYELMADLISADDQEGIAYLTELISMTNPIDNVNFDQDSNTNLEAAKRIYYLDESDVDKFEKKVVGDKTIFSLPTFYVTEESEKQKKIQNTEYENPAINTQVSVYFAAGKSTLDAKYHGELDKIYQILKDNPELYVEISGYASADGDEQTNIRLSNERAISVLNYLNHKDIVRRRFIARGYGETKVEAISKEEGRKVEVKIVPPSF